MKRKKLLKQVMAMTLAGSMVAGTAFSGVGVLNTKAADAPADNWEEVQSIVSRYYGEWKNTSYNGAISDQLPDTALLGNGDVGVTSGGNDTEKTFYVSKGDFWEYEGNPLPIGGVTIKEQEKAVEEGPENLAPGRVEDIQVSSRDTNEAFDPWDAVSGEIVNGENGYGWVSSIPAWGDQAKNDYWMQLKFKEPITFGRWVVKWDGYIRQNYQQNNPQNFSLLISDDGETWTEIDKVEGNKEEITDRNLEEKQTAQYVKLHITNPEQLDGDYARARVAQIEFYAEPKEEQPVVESDNLALNKPIKYCSAYTDKGVTHQGEWMIDGDTSTKWCSLHDDESTHWAIIDLGEKKNIGYYKLIHSGIVGETQHNTVDYQLQYLDADEVDWNTIEETDESLWKDMDAVSRNKETVTSKAFETPIQTRYVRLLITKPASSNKAARIHELELREEAPAEFYEKQDILNAEIQTTQELADVPVEMKTWLAANENIMVTEVTSKGTQDAAFEVETWAETNNSNIRPISSSNDEQSVRVTRTTWNRQSGNKDAHVSKAALSTKIIGVDDVVASSDNGSGNGNLKFTLGAGETVYVITAIGGGGRTYHNDGVTLWEAEAEPEAEAANILANVSDEAAIETINTERQEWWKDFWSTSYVDFGTEDEKLNKVQKYYYGAQYLLGSATREGEVAPGIYAQWHTTDRAWWCSDYHLNYNFMSAFYGTNSSNRPELSLPGVNALLGFVEEGQRRATSVEELKKIKADFVEQKIAKGDIDPEKGIEGAILYPVGIGPWGMTLDDHYHNEALNAAYNSYLMTQYYEYTKDKEFLENGVYDYMKQAVAFYEAWLEKEETTDNEDGYEYVLYAGYNEGSWAINPAVELAALKGTLRNLIRFSEELGRDEEKREDWIDIYEHLGEQPTTVVKDKTVLALGEKQWNGSAWVDLPSPIPGDGNALPLDAMIPGGVYNYFSTQEDLQMVRDTIDVFSERGAWSQANNFPRIFPEAVKARYDIDTVVTHLSNTIDRQMQANLRIKDGMHGIEKSGSTETINSMMLISEEGMTKIFPNWYADKDAKFVNLRAKGAFTVSAEYDGSAQEAKNVTITSEAGEDMTLVSPWAEGMTVRDSKGNVVAATKGTVPNWEDVENATYTFATTAGETYTVEKGETEQEKPSKATLEKLLNKAKEHKANGDVDDCVESVKKLFDEAIAEGEAVMADENATYEQIQKTTFKLMKAIQSLGMKAANKTDLQMAIELADGIDLSKYVEAGQVEFKDALAKAKEVYAYGDAFQKDVDAAWNTLVDALSNLRLKADKSTLDDLLNSIKDLDLSKYTDESVAVFKKALAKAQDVMADETLSEDNQAVVDDTVKLLADAKEQLVVKDDSDKNNGSEDQNSNGNNGDGQTPDNGNGNSTPDNKDKTNAPKTGDMAMPIGIFIFVVLAGGIVVISFKKNKLNK